MDDDTPEGGEVIDFYRPHKRAAPVRYSEALAMDIALTYGGSEDGLPTLCKTNNHWPDPKTIRLWRLKHPDFDDAMVRAWWHRFTFLMDGAGEDANDDSKDLHNGEPNPVAVARSKLRMEAKFKKVAMMMQAKGAAGLHHGDDYLPQDEVIKLLK